MATVASKLKHEHDSKECGFRLALSMMYNARIGYEDDARFIPQWLWSYLDINAKTNFIHCSDICIQFGLDKLKEFWYIVYKTGIPKHFIHVPTDQPLTSHKSKYETAHINLRVSSDIDFIQTTMNGDKLLCNLSLLNIHHAGKYMLYNNQYKKKLNQIFVSKENYCFEYYIKQCTKLYDQLITNDLNKYYAKYAVHNLLKDLLIETEEEMNEDEISLNIIIHKLKLEKMLKHQKLELMMDPEMECNEEDERLHTFEILTDKDKEWVKDKRRAKCQYEGCKHVFNGFNNRKHHCRACGEIFCNTHWKKYRFKRNRELDRNQAEIKDEKSVKVCNQCQQFYWFFVHKL